MAISHGLRELNQRGVAFNPNRIALANDFQFLPPHYSGAIALPPMEDRTGKGYEIVKYTKPNVSLPDTTAEELWQCVEKHYGISAVTGLMLYGSIPMEKIKLGYGRSLGAGKNTNRISHFGLKFFPRAVLPAGSPTARLAKTTFKTTRIFGIIGRAFWPMGICLAVFDIGSIGWCVYKALNEK